MVAFPPKDEYLALPWDLIRMQYENTDISIRKLAQLHGLSSKTILLRKIKGEGWTRHVGATATHLSLLQIPGMGSAPIPEVKRKERKERVDAQSRRDEGDCRHHPNRPCARSPTIGANSPPDGARRGNPGDRPRHPPPL